MRLELDEVSVRYAGRPAVAPLTRAVDSGEWLCLIGPNGAGKTSLLSAVAGLVAHGGSVVVGGRRLEALRARERARLVALVPQRPTVPEGFSVRDYVMLGRNPHLRPFAVESAHDLAVVDDILDHLELTAFAARTLEHLSGGELQRVLIGRALAQQAPVLLLDEPTSALDLGQQQQVLELVEQLRHVLGLTVVSTMHDLTLAGAHADRLLLLDAGEVVAEGAPDEVLNEATLERYYRARVQVLVADDGTRAVVPLAGRRAVAR